MKQLILLSFFVSAIACETNHKMPVREVKQDVKPTAEASVDFTPQFISGPPAIVYKTKKNYNKLVPVTLSEDKTTIVSYPHPIDVHIGNTYQTPDQLSNGYLLDNRGVNKNTAFLNMSYEDYAQLKSVPTLKEMYAMIIDKDPIAELCDCGNRKVIKDIIPQMNALIKANKLRSTCKVVK